MNRTILIGVATCSAAVVMAATHAVHKPAPPKTPGPYDVPALETQVLGKLGFANQAQYQLRYAILTDRQFYCRMNVRTPRPGHS
jgi:hypothetical protein